MTGHAAIAQYLLSLGARPNAKDMNGRTSLHHAAAAGHQDICEALIAAGASVGVEDDIGSTPIDLAVRLGAAATDFVQNHMADLAHNIVKRPSLIASPASSSGQTFAPRQVRKALAGHWAGHYEYLHWDAGTQDPWAVDFPATKKGNTALAGQNRTEFTTDLEFSTSGHDAAGLFACHGFVDSVGVVWFVKLYGGSGWLYKGRLSPDMKTIRGTWGGNKKLWYGTFSITKTLLDDDVQHLEITN